MGRNRSRVWRSALFVIAIAVALAFPLQSSATHNGGWWWHWGYNNLGANVNPIVQSGYNYWDDQYTDINSRAGGAASATMMRFEKPSGIWCGEEMYGPGEYYHATDECYGGDFVGAYIKNVISHMYGNTAYLYTDSMNLG